MKIDLTAQEVEILQEALAIAAWCRANWPRETDEHADLISSLTRHGDTVDATIKSLQARLTQS